MKKRTFYYIGLLLLIIFIQSTRFGFWTFYGIKPDFVLLLLFLISFKNGSIFGTVFGFVSGLIQDFFSYSLLGSGAFSKSLWGYLIGKSNQRLDTNSTFVQILLLFCISICDGILIHLLVFSLHYSVVSKGRLIYYIFGQAMYNCIIWPFFAYGVIKIERCLNIT